jgi:hypothetical protein
MYVLTALDASGSGHGPEAVPYEHGNELSGSIKSGEFLDIVKFFSIRFPV